MGKFKWSGWIPSKDEIHEIEENSKKGFIFEGDFEYPQELHKEHNSYPFAPEKKAVQKEWLSPLPKKK